MNARIGVVGPASGGAWAVSWVAGMTLAWRWSVAVMMGVLLASLGQAWLDVAHTVTLPAALLGWWPLPGGWAYVVHAALVAMLPLAGLGWAGGAILQHVMPLHKAPALRIAAMLPWLLAFPWVNLWWAQAAGEPWQAALTLAMTGWFLPAWLALPLGLARSTRPLRRQRWRPGM